MTDILWCEPGVFMTTVGDDVVILDVPSDAYHCLLEAGRSIRPTGEGRLDVKDVVMARQLVEMGLARPDRSDPHRRPPIPAVRELQIALKPSGLTLAATAWCWLGSLAAFQRRSLLQLVAGRRSPSHAPTVDEERLGDIVGAARLVRPWLPFEGECLQRSFQLRAVLSARGIHADWVFGVRTWPFNAHCWLQIGDLVVGDRLARVRRYTPIMRV